ncbi:MAG: hypothetical protein WC928_01820 [Patescibacteria group bacterium]|jgi:hypothetical protein
MKKIINLDEGVVRALEFFIQNKIPRLNLNNFDFPIVVGSGNAYNTAQILFSAYPAVIADESTFKKTIQNYKKLINKKTIKEVVVISASGEKDSIWEIKLAKKYKLKTTLLTCSPNSSASKMADKVFLFPKISEPYTYNISTYLGMILSATGENPKDIFNFIKKIKINSGFKKYEAFSFILPDDFAFISPMIEIKRSELFGPKVSLRAFSLGQARHAKFVVRDKKELVISLGKEKNLYFGDPRSRWSINLPDKVDFAFILCLTYYLVGKIQTSKPAYFKNNIEKYCQDYGPKAYGNKKKFDLIVSGN